MIPFYLDGCHCHFCQLSEPNKAYTLIRKIHGEPLISLRRFIEAYLWIEANYGAGTARTMLDPYIFADDGIRLKEGR